jgi:hypothetical protein
VSSEPEAEYVVPATSSSANDDRPDIERGLLDDDDGLLGRQGVTAMTSFSVVRVWSASQIFKKKKIPRPWGPSVGDGVSSSNLMY